MNRRAFAIVPAAGRSARMGQPKLLLPWGSASVIETVLSAWRAGGVVAIYMTVHPDDSELADVCRRAGAHVIVPSIPPPDMKASVRFALDASASREQPTSDDAWLVAPADLPTLSPEAIRRLISEFERSNGEILVPTCAGHRGHPVLFPWSLSAEVAKLPAEAGINALLQSFPVREIPVAQSTLEEDLDTPADYRRLRDRYDRHIPPAQSAEGDGR